MESVSLIGAKNPIEHKVQGDFLDHMAYKLITSLLVVTRSAGASAPSAYVGVPVAEVAQPKNMYPSRVKERLAYWLITPTLCTLTVGRVSVSSLE